MPQDTPAQNHGAFIQAELRPAVGSGSAPSRPLEPDASPDEIQGRLREALGDAERDYLGLDESSFPPESWQSVFNPSPAVNATVLDREAVLLNLENGVYYTLNPIGTAIWELFSDNRSLEEIFTAICERFDVSEPVARRDVATLATQLRQEGLITERR
jgi:hypothetical protein